MFRPTLIIAGIACIAVLSSGCGQHTAIAPAPQTQSSAAQVGSSPNQETQKQVWAQQQSAMMQAQMKAHPQGK